VISPADPLWHGTRADLVESIAESGLHCGERTHVHLAPAPDSKVGKRSRVEVLLEIDPVRLAAHGVEVFEAPNGVILVREVPPGCIVGVRPTDQAGHAGGGPGGARPGLKPGSPAVRDLPGWRHHDPP
jgi:RNA:NAD 2'-phosphotransferase (TPT1/KptA family)